MKRPIPLAWKNLTHDRLRLAAAVGGVLFAVLLMFVEVGFMFALFDSTVKILDDIDADIVLRSPARYALPAEKRFPIHRVYQARSCPGVASVEPIYIERMSAVLAPVPHGKGYPIRVIGVSKESELFQDSTEYAEAFQKPNVGFIDSKSKQPNFDFALEELTEESPIRVELSGKQIKLVGTFALGTDFANDGNLLVNTQTFATCFPWRGDGSPLDIVDLAVVQVAPGHTIEKVVEDLRKLLPGDVEITSNEHYRATEIDFWRKSTPIGMIFQMGVLLGFVVGIIICYQVIYTDVSDHMSEFATLKAMGYRNSYFVKLVLMEAFYLALLGFIPGLILASGIYLLLAQATGLLMLITPLRAGIVFLLTLIMCIVSGLIALRKLLSADPAELF